MTSSQPLPTGAQISARLDAIGITKSEFAQRADIDRGTLNRAIDDDERVTNRTRGRIAQVLGELEEEIGMAEAGTVVTSTIEYRGARITMEGGPSEVAEAIRQVIGD